VGLLHQVRGASWHIDLDTVQGDALYCVRSEPAQRGGGGVADVTHELVGLELPPSAWLLVSQDAVDVHARNTGDDDWLHTDQAAAAAGPMGGTIAQGFLLLSLFSTLHYGAMPALDERCEYLLNYGFDRVRFVRPVLTGRQVRAASTVSRVQERDDGRLVLTLAVELHVDDDDARPAVVADWLFLASLRPEDRS
jgi:acyl dehydratase